MSREQCYTSYLLLLQFIQIREIRQVPDTQEVYVAVDSDVSFIVEVLERVDPPNANEAVRSAPSIYGT